jgi:hypothetical protein
MSCIQEESGANSEQVCRVQDFLTRLWGEIFGEPPPLADDRRLLSQILVENLPPAPPYEPVDLRPFRRAAPGPPPEDGEDRALSA